MQPSEKDLAIRSGSNLDSFQALIERLQRAVKQQRQPVTDTFRALQRKKKSLLNKAAIKKLESAIDEEKRALDSAVLASMGNTTRIKQLKAQTRRKIHKLLTRSFPNARQIIALNKSHSQEYRRASQRLRDVFDESIRTGLEVALPDIDYDTFEAPFELHGVYSDLFQANQPSLPHEVDQYIIYNGSFVIPSWGVMANDFTFRHNHSSWLESSDFMQRENIAVLGIKYRMPRTGYLNVSAAIQNLSNNVTLSIRDNFGFSKAEIDATHSLYVIIVRPSGALFDLHYQVTVQAKLTSGGDDVSDSVSELQTTIPYSLNFSSPETFNEGDELSILIGTDVHVSSYLEFMNSRIDAAFVWLLKAMYVSVT
jgi:KaiC/GvpD/RAD55 family RecA-like ATPase